MAESRAADERRRAPSATVPEGNLAQVMVDTWGHRGEYVRGDIIRLSDLDPAHYDAEHAVRMGTLRLLSEAEARPESMPHTFAVDAYGDRDPAFDAAMRYYAGIPEEQPVTITTAQGPAEPAEFAKPTLAFTGDNAPPARPVQQADDPPKEAAERAARLAGPPPPPTSEEPATRRRRAAEE
jgi:hypothetical protein